MGNVTSIDIHNIAKYTASLPSIRVQPNEITWTTPPHKASRFLSSLRVALSPKFEIMGKYYRMAALPLNGNSFRDSKGKVSMVIKAEEESDTKLCCSFNGLSQRDIDFSNQVSWNVGVLDLSKKTVDGTVVVKFRYNIRE